MLSHSKLLLCFVVIIVCLVRDVTAQIPNQTAIVIGSLIGGLLLVCCILALVYIWVSCNFRALTRTYSFPSTCSCYTRVH